MENDSAYAIVAPPLRNNSRAISIKSSAFGACSREATRGGTFIFTRWDQAVFLFGQGDLVVGFSMDGAEKKRVRSRVGSCATTAETFSTGQPLFVLVLCRSFYIPRSTFAANKRNHRVAKVKRAWSPSRSVDTIWNQLGKRIKSAQKD